MAFFDSSLLSCHFRLFTEVLRKVFGSLTQEVWEFFGETPDYPLRPTAMAGRQRMSRIRTVGAAVSAAYFGANDATIFSKHGSPRSRSHHGISFNSP